MARADEPAFPQTEGMQGLNVTGLSVRELYAFGAMIGLLANETRSATTDEPALRRARAAEALAIADAMIAASAKK